MRALSREGYSMYVFVCDFIVRAGEECLSTTY